MRQQDQQDRQELSCSSSNTTAGQVLASILAGTVCFMFQQGPCGCCSCSLQCCPACTKRQDAQQRLLLQLLPLLCLSSVLLLF